MREPKIYTNHHWRDFVCRYDVPEKVLKDEFDWTDDCDGFFEYKGCWYHLSQFMRVGNASKDSPLHGWHGVHGDSFSSGIVIRLSDDGEQYQVGTYIQ